jgi:hypothetical protein
MHVQIVCCMRTLNHQVYMFTPVSSHPVQSNAHTLRHRTKHHHVPINHFLGYFDVTFFQFFNRQPPKPRRPTQRTVRLTIGKTPVGKTNFHSWQRLSLRFVNRQRIRQPQRQCRPRRHHVAARFLFPRQWADLPLFLGHRGQPNFGRKHDDWVGRVWVEPNDCGAKRKKKKKSGNQDGSKDGKQDGKRETPQTSKETRQSFLSVPVSTNKTATNKCLYLRPNNH